MNLRNDVHDVKEAHLMGARMLLKLRPDVSVTASGRIFYCVGTYLLLRRDVIFISSVGYDSSSHQPFRKEAVTNQIASRSLAYQLLIYQCL